MNDLKPFRHGEEGTHGHCLWHSGKDEPCCICSPRKQCSWKINNDAYNTACDPLTAPIKGDAKLVNVVTTEDRDGNPVSIRANGVEMMPSHYCECLGEMSRDDLNKCKTCGKLVLLSSDVNQEVLAHAPIKGDEIRKHIHIDGKLMDDPAWSGAGSIDLEGAEVYFSPIKGDEEWWHARRYWFNDPLSLKNKLPDLKMIVAEAERRGYNKAIEEAIMKIKDKTPFLPAQKIILSSLSELKKT